MTEKEFNEIPFELVSNIETKWYNGIGIIKKYHRKEIVFAEDNLFLFGRTEKILPKMTYKDAKRLKSLGWHISNIYEGMPMMAKKL